MRKDQESRRTDRVAESLIRSVSLILQRLVKDPRVADVTITHAKVTPDLREGRLYFTVTSEAGLHADRDTPVIKSAEAALNHAAGFIYRELRRLLETKVVPRVTFHYDDTFIEGSRIDCLLAKIHREDAGGSERPGGAEDLQER